MNDMKTPEDWQDELDVVILDPDGWDRSNIETSWETPLTKDEFIERALVSTIRPGKKFFELAREGKI